MILPQKTVYINYCNIKWMIKGFYPVFTQFYQLLTCWCLYIYMTLHSSFTVTFPVFVMNGSFFLWCWVCQCESRWVWSLTTNWKILTAPPCLCVWMITGGTMNSQRLSPGHQSACCVYFFPRCLFGLSRDGWLDVWGFTVHEQTCERCAWAFGELLL